MHYNYLNKHGILLNKKVLGEDVDEDLKRVENEFYIRSKPVVYGGEKGLLIKLEKDFELSCLILQQNGMQKPEEVSIFKFYQAIELINKQKEHGRHKKRK